MTEATHGPYMFKACKQDLAKAGLWGRGKFKINTKESTFILGRDLSTQEKGIGMHVIYDSVLRSSAELLSGKNYDEEWLDAYTDHWFEFFTKQIGESQ